MITDALGNKTTFNFDGDSLSSITAPNGTITTIDSDANGNITGESYSVDTAIGSFDVTWDYDYSASGRVDGFRTRAEPNPPGSGWCGSCD